MWCWKTINKNIPVSFCSPQSVRVNDGNWHHLCSTWNSQDGAYKIYKDGNVVGSGTIATGKTIPGNGIWVLGQDQDSRGGAFVKFQAFQGEMVEVNIFDRVLSSEEISEMSQSCALSQKGNVKSWNDFKSGVKGNIEVVNATCCR